MSKARQPKNFKRELIRELKEIRADFLGSSIEAI